jgi:predicted metal-binding protein
MPLRILQPSACGKACPDCPNASGKRLACDGQSGCSGYGTKTNCPPLIVLASLEWARLALAASGLPVPEA